MGDPGVKRGRVTSGDSGASLTSESDFPHGVSTYPFASPSTSAMNAGHFSPIAMAQDSELPEDIASILETFERGSVEVEDLPILDADEVLKDMHVSDTSEIGIQLPGGNPDRSMRDESNDPFMGAH